jgi:hypothetical protein
VGIETRQSTMPRHTLAAVAVASLGSASHTLAEQWYFYIEDNTSPKITRLETKEKSVPGFFSNETAASPQARP